MSDDDPEDRADLDDDVRRNLERRDRMNAAIGSALDDGEILSGWLLVGNVLDEDGDPCTFIHTAPGQNVITDLGLATYLSTRIKHSVICHGVPVPFADDGD